MNMTKDIDSKNTSVEDETAIQEADITDQQVEMVFGDTDTLSSLLNRGEFGIFVKVFQNIGARMVISQIVYDELVRGKRQGETRRRLIEPLIKQQTILCRDIDPVSDEAYTYRKLQRIMDRGEASVLSMAIHTPGKTILASNNLSDIQSIAESNGIEVWTTAKILAEAVFDKIITVKHADVLWKKMVEDGIKLPRKYNLFQDYYKEYLHIKGEN
jgi:predicted nucleic acid-binding protein